LIIPIHVALPLTTNTPQRILNTTDNLILASMLTGSNNTLGSFGLLGISSLTNLRVTRIRLAADTAGVLLFGVYSPTTTSFYECYRTQVTGARYASVDDDFQPRSISTSWQDWLTIPQSNGYVPALTWSVTPTGSAVNVSGEIQISNTLGQVTGPIVT
jgi:hypothetical protein